MSIDVFGHPLSRPLASRGLLGPSVTTSSRSAIDDLTILIQSIEERINEKLKQIETELQLELPLQNAKYIAKLDSRLTHLKNGRLQGNYKWINLLPTLMIKYNNKKNRAIGMKPKDVTVEDTRELLRRIRYTPNWTTEIFTVEKVKLTKPVYIQAERLSKSTHRKWFLRRRIAESPISRCLPCRKSF
ncbi:uncharacterized protein LOC122507567 [Leptopilina heterotoma]|uniref:uncharacterized protein LOC122507567 n=1 Tax=Leptopilina heterotoma TaxID=63436 RepID=UPI001CA953EF|nr:uncharacterized protein LOC122507567 [Leptopilina heterotoma]